MLEQYGNPEPSDTPPSINTHNPLSQSLKALPLNAVFTADTKLPQDARTDAAPIVNARTKGAHTTTDTAPTAGPSDTADTPDADLGISDYGKDMAKGAYNGVISTVQETGQFAWDVGTGIGEWFGYEAENDKMPYYDSLEEFKATTTTMAGKLTEDVVNFGLGMLGAGKVLKVAKVLQGGSRLAAFGRVTASGVIADAVAMDPMQERLSNLVESYPALKNPLTEALQAKEGDTRWEGRLKNAVEGVLLGAAADTLIGGVKFLRAKMRGDTKGMNAALAEVEQGTARAQQGTPLSFREASPEEFITMRESSKRPEFLTPYTAEEMQGWRRFTTDDGVGFALKPDGDIIGVVNNSGRKGAGEAAVIEALAQGGKTLDCVDGWLADNYTKFGFVEKKRMKWDDQYAPKGWQYDKYGRPDIVFFEYPEGLSRNRDHIRRRFEAARLGESGSGGGRQGSGGSGSAPPSETLRPGVVQGTPGTADRGTGVSQRVLDGKAPHAGASSFPDPLHEEFRLAAHADPDIDPGMVYKAAAENTKTTDELLQRLPHVINQHRMGFMADKALKLNEAVCEVVYDKTLHSEGVESINALTEKALKELQDLDSPGFADKLAEALERTTAASAEGRELRVGIMQIRQAHNLMALRLSELGEILTTMGAKDSAEGLKMVAEMDSICRTMGQLTVAIRDAGTTAGRNLRAFRQTADGTGLLLKAAPNVEAAIRKALSEGRLADPKEWTEKLKRVDFREMVNNPKYAKRVAEAMLSRNGWQMLKEAYISSILYGVRTNVTNMLSNAAQVGFTPMFRAVGNIGEKGLLESARQELNVYSYLKSNVSHALKYANKAFLDSRGVLDSAGAKFSESMGPRSGWTAENIRGRKTLQNLQEGMTPEQAAQMDVFTEIKAKIVDTLGTWLVRFPGRALEWQDEFFKQLAYRSEVEASAYAEALERFGRVNSKEIKEFVDAKLAAAFDDAGRATDASGLNYARRMTFTQPLKPGSAAAWLQSYGNREGIPNSLVKLAVPFVRTPTNIMVGALEYLPFLQRFSSNCREALAKGGREAAEMQGKARMGGLIIAGGLMAAAEGRITGSMPRDAQMREAALRGGWQPNSFKVGDTWVSYQRGDPIAPLLTVMADFTAAAPYLKREEFQEFGSALMYSVMHMLTDKSYMQGIQNIMELFSGDTGRLGRFGGQLASGMIPNFIREGARWKDDYQRDLNTFSSRLQNAIPGWSESLPAKYDWLTGKPIAGGLSHLLGIKSINDDPVAYEIANLGGLMKTPGYKLGASGVELSEEQHSRYCELIGTIKLDGKTLYETLDNVIHSKDYDLERERDTEPDGFRSPWLKRICTSYRKAALHKLQEEYPALAQAVREEKLERRDNKETTRSIQAEGLFRGHTAPARKRDTTTEQLRQLSNL